MSDAAIQRHWQRFVLCRLQPCDDCGGDFDPADLSPAPADPRHVVCSKCGAKDRERVQATREIVDTETRYGADLRVLRDVRPSSSSFFSLEFLQ